MTSLVLAVTLPSNGNIMLYSVKAMSHSFLKMGRGPNLAGQTPNDDARWQVALMSIHYKHNLCGFGKQCTMRVLIKKRPARQMSLIDRRSAECTEVHGVTPQRVLLYVSQTLPTRESLHT
jgi:hypothetical protein